MTEEKSPKENRLPDDAERIQRLSEPHKERRQSRIGTNIH